MNATVREEIERIPMSIEEYEALDENSLDEYINGALMARPSPQPRHEDTCVSLLKIFHDTLPRGVVAYQRPAWSTGGNRFRPDVLVADDSGDTARLTETPYLIVEVVGDDRFYDTVIKHQLYAAAGLERYWIVDPEQPTVSVYHRLDGDFHKVGNHAPGKKATLDVGPTKITLDPAELVV